MMVAMGNAKATADLLRLRLKDHDDLPPPQLCRALRRARNLTQRDIADAVGVTRQAIALWESGARVPRGERLERYADAMRVLREAA
jgi:DNA-binding XRE family transcriptional regulator